MIAPADPVTVPSIPSSWQLGEILGALGIKHFKQVLCFEKSKKKLKFDEHLFEINEIDEKYYLSDKVSSYVLSEGTKNFKTRTETDLKVARPLLQSMHKMHRAGVDNYVTHTGRIRKLTPRCIQKILDRNKSSN